MSGWIKIHRPIKEHWIWSDPLKFKWWLIMIMDVNYAEGKINLGNELFIINPGQSAKSLRSWADSFDCGTKAVINFFYLLEKDGMITKKTIGKGKQSTTLINISNYSNYQGVEETQRQRKRNASATQAQHEGHTIEEGKESKELKNINNNIPTLEEFLKTALSKDPSLDELGIKLKYESWVENGWKNGNDKEILNWKSSLNNTIPFMKKKEKSSAKKEKEPAVVGRMTQQDLKDNLQNW